MTQNSSRRRIVSVVAGSLLVAGSGLVAGVALAGSANADDTVNTATTQSPGARIKDFLGSVLSGLVSKGTITQEQSDAITSGIDTKIAEQEKVITQFRTQAEALVAKAHHLTIEQYREKLSLGSLTPLTEAQRSQLQTDLQALATSLGLPADGPWMNNGGMRGFGGPGRGHHGPGGHHGFGFDGNAGTSQNAPTSGTTTNSSYVAG